MLANYIDILGNTIPLPAGTNPDIGAYEIDQGISSQNEAKLANISIYPNPSRGQIYLSEIVDVISLYTVAGALLMREKATDHLVVDNVSGGVYIVKLEQDNKTKNEKVLILK